MVIRIASKNEPPRRAEPSPEARKILEAHLEKVVREAQDSVHLASEWPDPAAKPSLPIDPPSPKIKASRKDQRKAVLSIRIDPDILEKFRATGHGWQARINDILRKAIE